MMVGSGDLFACVALKQVYSQYSWFLSNFQSGLEGILDQKFACVASVLLVAFFRVLIVHHVPSEPATTIFMPPLSTPVVIQFWTWIFRFAFGKLRK